MQEGRETEPDTSSATTFLSHNSRDKPVVEGLAWSLLDRGIRVWFDKWDLTPGRPWIPEIESALGRAETSVST